jgi:hypothetical protein
MRTRSARRTWEACGTHCAENDAVPTPRRRRIPRQRRYRRRWLWSKPFRARAIPLRCSWKKVVRVRRCESCAGCPWSSVQPREVTFKRGIAAKLYVLEWRKARSTSCRTRIGPDRTQVRSSTVKGDKACACARWRSKWLRGEIARKIVPQAETWHQRPL